MNLTRYQVRYTTQSECACYIH